MSDFRKLKVWQKAHAMSLHAHSTARRIRGHELVALRSQIVRSAMSVPANIVEGRNQKGDAAFARYLRISIGSAAELEYHMITARDVGAISPSDYLSLYTELSEVRMMLHGLVRNLDRTGKDVPAHSR
ncbi:MAG TPA: four helix bundle protein [Gemmatimonadaceae bacterium]|nr:four helix bundle protein [Gemmatimonadaceae bacterium]